MTQNPLYNAILAAGYIVLIVHVIFFGGQFAQGGEETILIPIAMLSLFVLSAAMMGYTFFFHPVQMYLDGHKKEAVNLFVKTIGYFAGITVLLLAIVFFGSALMH